MRDPIAGMDTPIKIKVVVIVYFHTENSSGEMGGEFKHWLNRYGLPHKLSFPQGDYDLYLNDEGVLGFVAGIGVNTATASVMGLGMDPRLDLSKAYWLVAGVGGAAPQAMTIGGVALARYVVDADKKHMLDPREMPDDWKYGVSPYGSTTKEFPEPLQNNYRSVFQLNQGIVNWAFQLTKDIDLSRFVTQQDIEFCARFKNDSAAQAKPKVMLGEVLSGDNFWHGRMMNEWATEWVAYWTEGNGEFSICCCEDAGVLTALTLLDRAGRVDYDRIIVSRAASNFVCQWDGATAGESMAAEDVLELTALNTALESAYAVGSCIADELCGNWGVYEDLVPSG